MGRVLLWLFFWPILIVGRLWSRGLWGKALAEIRIFRWWPFSVFAVLIIASMIWLSTDVQDAFARDSFAVQLSSKGAQSDESAATRTPRPVATAGAGRETSAYAKRRAPVRESPGRFGAELRRTAGGERLEIVAILKGGDWYLLADGGWLHSRHVSDAGSYPAVTVTPTPTRTPRATATPTVAPSSTPADIGSVAPQCDVEIVQEGRGEPEYVDVEGYILGDRPDDAYDALPSTPWYASLLVQTGPELWEPGDDVIVAGTSVVVLEQYLKHERFGRYSGRLMVQSTVDEQTYIIDPDNFTPADYRHCPPHMAVGYGPFIALVDEDIRPIDQDGAWAEWGESREVYCDGRPGIGEASSVEDGVECFVYKQYRNGFGGVQHFFPSSALEIIYPTDGSSTDIEIGDQSMTPTSTPAAEAVDSETSQDGEESIESASSGPYANRGANLREGPGTDFAIVGGVAENDSLDLAGRNATGDWYQLSSGAWIAAFLVENAADNLPVVEDASPAAPAPAATSTTEEPTVAAVAAGNLDARLTILVNRGSEEILGIVNQGTAPLDIGGWVLYGSKGDDRCVIPGGTVIDPGATYQVATGDSVPVEPGMKCGDKPIWNNSGETIFLQTPDGEISVESRRV